MNPPSIPNIRRKVQVLKRRRDHLSRRLEARSATPGETFDRAEIGALDAAIDALAFVYRLANNAPLDVGSL